MVLALNAKWDDAANELRVFCDNDTGNSEFQVKWDDSANTLKTEEILGTKEQIKWDDTGNNLETEEIRDCIVSDCQDDCG